MNHHMRLALALLLGGALGHDAASQITNVTPVSSGLVVNQLFEVVDNGPQDQTDPHISGDLASYTDFSNGFGQIGYYHFLYGIRSSIPALGGVDTLSSVDGTRIAFSRYYRRPTGEGCTNIWLHDIITGTGIEIDPHICSVRLATAIGGRTVAFVDGTVGNGDVFAHDLETHTSVNLSLGLWGSSGLPNVAPDGNTVVWQECDPTFNLCDVYAALWDPGLGAWSAPMPVSREMICNPQACFPAPGPTSHAINPDTDGTWIVYQDNLVSPTDSDIYFFSLADGLTRRLALPGIQRNPSVRDGVITFESKQSSLLPADLFVYVIATNRLYQITSTPIVDESENNVTVLPNGDVRVIWAANDGSAGTGNIYASTFTPHRVFAIDNVSQAEGPNGSTAFTFTVSLLPSGIATATVDFATVDGTATAADGDYVPVSGTLTFSLGETTKTITVLVNGDTKFEADETFSVVLSNPLHAVVSTSHGVGTGTIQNDDTVLPILSIGDVVQAEGHGGTTPFTFTVSLSAPSSQTVTVNYKTVDGGATVTDGDYLATAGNLVFAPGEVSKTIDVLVNGDTKFEADEAFGVVLSPPTNATLSSTNGAALGVIQNDDADNIPPVVLSIVRNGASPTDAFTVSWTVTFSEDVTGVDPTDFVVLASGVPNAGVSAVILSPSASVYIVTASTGLGFANGTVALKLADNDSIRDGAGNPLGGVGAGNGDFTGEAFTIVRVPATPIQRIQLLMIRLSDPALGLNSGQVTSLAAKLNVALHSLVQGNTTQAINQLIAFRSEVTAAANAGWLSAAVAASLITEVNAIIAMLA